MILGLGNDLVDIRRIGKVLDRFGESFLDRIYSDEERRQAETRAVSREGIVAFYAKRFAAKEACAKALGSGFRYGVSWRDISVRTLESGQPTLHLTAIAADRLASLVPAGMSARIHLAMTDEFPLAQATVILSAVPQSADGL